MSFLGYFLIIDILNIFPIGPKKLICPCTAKIKRSGYRNIVAGEGRNINTVGPVF
jgi:hypothetical protein